VVLVNRTEYEHMKELGFIKEGKNSSNRAICNRHKSGKHKTYFVQEDVVDEYKKQMS